MSNALFGAIVGLIGIYGFVMLFKDVTVMYITVRISERRSKKFVTEMFDSEESFDDAMDRVPDLTLYSSN